MPAPVFLISVIWALLIFTLKGVSSPISSLKVSSKPVVVPPAAFIGLIPVSSASDVGTAFIKPTLMIIFPNLLLIIEI